MKKIVASPNIEKSSNLNTFSTQRSNRKPLIQKFAILILIFTTNTFMKPRSFSSLVVHLSFMLGLFLAQGNDQLFGPKK